MLPSHRMQKASAPMPFMVGSTMVMAMAVAIAASTALPPFASMRRPAVAARCWEEATTLDAKTGSLMLAWGKSYVKDGTQNSFLLLLLRRQPLDARHEARRLQELAVLGLALAEQAGPVEHARSGDLAHPAGKRDALAEPQGF